MSSGFFQRFSLARGRGLLYPSPFFDIAQTYMPPTVKELFKWCRYYFYTHPIINPVVSKLASYPITELIYQEIKKDDGTPADETAEPNTAVVDAYRKILEKVLDITTVFIGAGLDYFVYGNAFISISFPFRRQLVCSSCKQADDVRSMKGPDGKYTWTYRDGRFHFTCSACQTRQSALPEDQPLRDHEGVRIIRWDPENINISYNPSNGRSTYTYIIPPKLKKDITNGVPEIVIDTPAEFLNAVKDGMDLRLNPENFLHMARWTLAEQDQGWGKPLILPAMRDAFYLQVLRKANEAIAFQYIVPLTVLFPQPHGNLDPYKHMNLGRWRERVEEELAAWKDDPNHLPIMPVPMGNQQIFGTGRALMVTPEIRALSEQMVTGMGVPTEFIFGGLSYSGSSVSLRIVENTLLRYRENQTRLLDFVTEHLRRHFNLPRISVYFREFKMADDIQQQQLVAGLMQAFQISNRAGLDKLGVQVTNDTEQLRQEGHFRNELAQDQILAQAEAQGEASVIMAKFQAEAQKVMMEQQLAHQNQLLRSNPAAGQYLLQAQAAQAGGAAPGGAAQLPPNPYGQAAPPQDEPLPEEQAAPDQTQTHTGPETPTEEQAAQAGYGHGQADRVIDPRLLALHIASQLRALPTQVDRQYYMGRLASEMPQLNSLVLETMKRRAPYATEPPMPTQLPPRRQGGSPV